MGPSGRPLNENANLPFQAFKSLVPSATKVSLGIIACSVTEICGAGKIRNTRKHGHT
jgi:hypothetical protein